VRIACTTLCGTDAHLWDGRLAGLVDVVMPMIHGHEMLGRVCAIDRIQEYGSVVWNFAIASPIISAAVDDEREAVEAKLDESSSASAPISR
jgi:threonine dehydrogenase-like Zn-dependent dehydrogenase